MTSKWRQFQVSILNLLLILAPTWGNRLEQHHALSVASMPPLLELEKKLIDNLEDYANVMEQKLQVLRSYIPVLRAENAKGRKDAMFYLSNPLNAHSLIRRLHQDWPKWRIYMIQPVGTAQIRNFDSWKTDLPTNTDLCDACAGIVRIKSIYDLQVEDIIQGQIDGCQYNFSMSSADIFAVGYHLAKRKAELEGIQWLQEAVNRLQNEPPHLSIAELEVLKLLAECHLNENKYSKALSLVERCLKIEPQRGYFIRLRHKINKLIRDQTNGTIEKEKQPEKALEMAFKLSCRGFLNTSTKLHCSYNFSTTPFLRFAPLKMEQVGLNPYVVLYHEVLSPQESAQLIELAASDLKASGVFQAKGSTFKRLRTVKARWIKKELNELTKRITRRIRDMTGFDLKEAEKFQIINYGIGGHYNMHKDYFNLTKIPYKEVALAKHFGDRIATVLFYGGATVFPMSGYTIYPRAGTALLWYNLHTDGHCDPSTLHAACPVMVGSKWVMTEWIRERGQMFIRPCLKPSA
ncbi:prolyl 4-hydroxylase subunit alpha-2-like isoform X2 [Drosophila santomea]|uniref:prolyl 4-hydroxylase subunit alpha-2-like isoform X2 n=1 Tax=Drosophila santomea TaxID=129105 RepID=UPI001953DA64|nr:prolyl 4-hydroxylase subunit alpha-2-like isoform X2 [Drosophila santomea]